MVNGYTEYKYDAIDRMAELTHPPGTNEQDRIYHSYTDKLVTITDENDKVRRYTYDAYGRISKVELILDDPAYTTEYEYDAFGNLIKISINEGDYVITYKYDSMGRLVQKDDPNSGTAKYIYNDAGNLRFIQDANHAEGGDWVYKKYDAIGRLIEEGEIYDVNPNRNSANNPNYPTDGSWRIKRYYDNSYSGSTNPKANLVRELVSPDGVVCEYMAVYSYDKRDRVTSKTVYYGDTTTCGLTISYEYDAQDNLIKIIYPDDEATIYKLNGLMLCDTVKTDSNQLLAKIRYNDNERPSNIYMRNSSTFLTYYPRDWVDNITSGSCIRNYTYDNVGNVVYEQREGGDYDYGVSCTYDDMYRLTDESYTGSFNGQISYLYDYLHNRIQVNESGDITTYEYEPNSSRLIKVGLRNCENDANGNMLALGFSFMNNYNYRNELITRGIYMDQYLYLYDSKGNRVMKKKGIGSISSFTYYICDESDRVIFETDSTPNLLKNSNFENGNDWSPWYTYTPRGSCTWTVVNYKGDHAKGGVYAIKSTTKTDDWETFIQKVQFENCPVPFVVSAYIKTQDLANGIKIQVDFYDGVTYLSSKSSNLISGTNDWVQVILPVYSSDIPIETDNMDIFVKKFAGTGTAWIDCFRLEGGDSPSPNDVKYIYVNNTHLAKIDAFGDPYFYHCDALGTPVKITDKDGNIVREETYYAFGSNLSYSGTFYNTHRFTGKESEETGVYYFGARYYDPTLGRFLTPEPLGMYEKENPVTLNPYVYCSNNPLKYIDPDGYYQTKSINGVFVVYTPKMGNYLAKTVASNIPVVGGAVNAFDCILRASSGDLTFRGLEVSWGIAKSISGFFGSNDLVTIGAEKAHRILWEYMNPKNPTDVYEGFSEGIQTQIIDPDLFQDVVKSFSDYNLKVVDTGGELQINLEHLDKVQRREVLKYIDQKADERARELRNEKPELYYLEPF